MKTGQKSILILLILCFLAAFSGCFIRGRLTTRKLNELLRNGNDSLFAKQYEEAIKWYDAGLRINPGEPTFLSNKSTVFRMRGVERYNSAIRLKDAKTRNEGKEFANQDFRDAAALSTEAVNRMKSLKFLEFLDRALDQQSAKLNIYASRADALRLFATLADKTKSGEALEAMHEYIEIETDLEKKTKAHLNAGKMLIDTGRGDDAITEYKKVLAIEPNNIEAVLGVGLALSQSGDMEKYHEAESYLQRFVEQAPDNHPLKTDIKNTLEFMKQEIK